MVGDADVNRRGNEMKYEMSCLRTRRRKLKRGGDLRCIISHAFVYAHSSNNIPEMAATLRSLFRGYHAGTQQQRAGSRINMVPFL